MSDNKRINPPNDAVDKILGNISPEIPNSDGQYIPFGFAAQTNVSEPINWGPHPASNTYINYGLHYPEAHLPQPSREQLTNYLHDSNSMFDIFPKNVNLPEYNNYNIRANGAPQAIYNYPPNVQENIMHNSMNPNMQSSPIFDNIVGNWTVPNNTGTYTPFGNTDTFKSSLFDFQNQNGDTNFAEKQEVKYKQSEHIDDKFNFNRDTKKARPLAEVKPMRPSYSDVLTKPVPSTSNIKPLKSESKDIRFKKDSRKCGKTDKSQKIGNILNRCNTNNDIRDISNDKSFSNKNDKKLIKNNQLNRKWASLDNISEPNLIKSEESKKIKKQEESNVNNKASKTAKNKVNRNTNNVSDDTTDTNIKITESTSISKNNLKKNKTPRQKQNDVTFNGNERPSSKRNQRIKKKDNQPLSGVVGQQIQIYVKRWWEVTTVFVLWLFHLISDVCSLSVHLGRDFAVSSWTNLVDCWHSFTSTGEAILKRWRLSAWIWEEIEEKCRGQKKKTQVDEEPNSFLQNGLETNINMPTTGDEAMKRLLACKGKDPYSILGVTPKCTDDDIKKYYKRQAVLVHPDKNSQPGAEEAFKILVHAFDMIGTSERRVAYDRGVAESAFVVQNFSQMAELLQKLQQKMEMNANTIRCSACGERHKRIKIDRPSYAARNCHMCRIHHAAREGDIWAEARCFGFLWHYYACMEGSVYDITDWAGCQKDTLKHLKPDSHHVQYRIALGKQNNQPRRNSSSPRMERPYLENLLNSLYGHAENGGASRRKTKNKK